MGEGRSKAAGKVAATALSSNSSAESWPPNFNSVPSNGSKVALLIGVSEYDSGFAELPGAVKDAQAMQTVLSDSSIGKFDQVLPLLENPDSSQMQQAMNELFANRGEDDLVLLYFSGHGFKDIDNKLYLGAKNASRDTYGSLINTSVIPASFVHDLMNQCRSNRQIIILDCCFSGAFPEGFIAKDDTSIDIRSQLGGKGRVILSSSGATQLSFSGVTSALSPYTQYLIEGMCEGKGCADELHQYVKQKIQAKFPALKPEMYAEQEGKSIQIFQSSRSSGDINLLMNKLIGGKTLINQSLVKTTFKKFGISLLTLIIFLFLWYLWQYQKCSRMRYGWYNGGDMHWTRRTFVSGNDDPRVKREKKICHFIGNPIN